jgi:hypothetical protein
MRDESKWVEDLNSAAVARKGNGCMRLPVIQIIMLTIGFLLN